MRAIVNEEVVEERAGVARRTMTAGIVLLFAAMFLSVMPRYVLPAYGLVFLGLIVLNRGGRAASKWLRKPRADQMLAKALKGLNHGHRLYSYVLPAEHVILSPTGLFVLKVKPQDGKISCGGDKWSRQFSPRHLLSALTEERLGNPSKQVQGEVDEVRRFVTSYLPDVDVPIRPAVVFTDSNVELDVEESTVPVLALRDLKAHLRSAGKEMAMPRETLKALTHLLDEQAV